VEQFFALPEAERKNRFFDLWTFKEAYIKACGKGLSIALEDFSYLFSGADDTRVELVPEVHEQDQPWHIWQLLPGELHKVALATKGQQLNESCTFVQHKIMPSGDFHPVDLPIRHKGVLPR